MIKICHKYVFDEFTPQQAEKEGALKQEEDLDLQLMKLNQQLEKEKNELEL